MSVAKARTVDRIHTVAALRRQNLTTAEIASHLGVTKRSVERYAATPAPPPDHTSTASWVDRGACRDVDPEMFFLPSYQPTHPQVHEARAVCARCPVLEACARYVEANPQPDGIWAATTPSERRRHRATTYERSTA